MTTDSNAPTVDTVDGASVAESIPTGAVCSNCGTPLLGEHCYHCGQPVSGLVRHFTSVVGDIADTLFEIDTRLSRTMMPLLLRPGFLSCEYFAGRRIRYVSPVRLFFFISVITFFVAQWSINQSNMQALQVDSRDSIDSAVTVAAVEQQRETQLKALDASTKAISGIPEATKDLSKAEARIRTRAEDRIAELSAAQAQGKPPPVHENKITFGDSDKPWDPVANPIKFSALPAFANRWLNQMAARAQGNVARIQQDPRVLFDAVMSAAPSTLFLLLPVFALLLKLTYFFKKRLYMEHFIVALHSHAFLCLALLLVIVLDGLEAVTPSTWMHLPLEIMKVVLLVWMPVYLLLMQKRVYGQGWMITLIKYAMLGFVYWFLLMFGAFATLLVKVVWL
jgi:hypothetical protein